jgi:hypothetical protein
VLREGEEEVEEEVEEDTLTLADDDDDDDFFSSVTRSSVALLAEERSRLGAAGGGEEAEEEGAGRELGGTGEPAIAAEREGPASSSDEDSTSTCSKIFWYSKLDSTNGWPRPESPERGMFAPFPSSFSSSLSEARISSNEGAFTTLAPRALIEKLPALESLANRARRNPLNEGEVAVEASESRPIACCTSRDVGTAESSEVSESDPFPAKMSARDILGGCAILERCNHTSLGRD